MTPTPPPAPEQGWLTERESHAWRSLLNMQSTLMRRIAVHLQQDSGLSEADYHVLVRLSEAPDERMRPFELMVATQWEQSRLSHHISRMVERGLVVRERCPSDQRGAVVALTDLGRCTITRAAPDHVSRVRRAFIDALTPDQLDTLGELADQILDHLEALDAESGQCPTEADLEPD